MRIWCAPRSHAHPAVGGAGAGRGRGGMYPAARIKSIFRGAFEALTENRPSERGFLRTETASSFGGRAGGLPTFENCGPPF